MADHPHGVRMIVAYDGTDFSGWQTQDGQRTVQATLEEAAARVARHPIRVRGAGRTDAGVHADGQVAAFGTTREMTTRRWVLALNRYLPGDVAVQEASPCEPDYDPRFDAIDKIYRYLFNLAPIRRPLLRERAWHLAKHVRFTFPDRDSLAGGTATLDLHAMRRAAERLVGTHDFAAFRAAADTRETTDRTMKRVELLANYRGDPDIVALEVEGTAFMKNMVRIIAGTLIDVGRGRLSVSDVQALLDGPGDRHDAGDTAPAHGLTLVRVRLGRRREQASR